MSAKPLTDTRPHESLSARWSDLAERRKAYYIELYRSGRWRHYFGEAEFVARMHDVLAAAKSWQLLAARDTSVPPLKRAS